jgi:hypothetical protein
MRLGTAQHTPCLPWDAPAVVPLPALGRTAYPLPAVGRTGCGVVELQLDPLVCTSGAGYLCGTLRGASAVL